MHIRSLRAASSTIGALLALAGSARAQFAVGDAYLISTGVTNPGMSCAAPAIVRITPALGTWNASVITRPTVLNGRGCYDSFRQRIVACRTPDLAPTLIDSAGAETPLTNTGTNRFALAAQGPGGKLYVWGTAQLSYFDASNTLQSVLNTSGSGPYVFPGGGVVGALHYDAGTSSLFFASAVAGDLTEIARVPLNAAGTQVIGAPATMTFDASPGPAAEAPVGFSKGPLGLLFLKIDDNPGQAAARMRLIDPSTLAVSTFATSDYFGAGGETAGAFVPSLNKAVVVDTLNDVLRTFGQGEAGAGTTISLSGGFVSGCGSGELAQMVVIEAAPVVPACYANCDGSTGSPVLSAGDFICFLGRFRAAEAYANCDGSTGSPTLTAADFICFLGRFRAGCG